MTELDLDRLEAVADAATGVDWPSADLINDGCQLTQAEVVFIAETGPDVIKELVKQLREARAGLADAWDEGYQRGTAEHCDEFDCDITSPNPYRRNDE